MNGLNEKNAIWLWNKEWRPLFTSLLMLMSQAYHYSTLFYYTAFFTLSLAKRRIEVNKSEGMMNPYFITVARCRIKLTCCRQGQKLGVNGGRVGAYSCLPPSLHNWFPFVVWRRDVERRGSMHAFYDSFGFDGFIITYEAKHFLLYEVFAVKRRSRWTEIVMSAFICFIYTSKYLYLYFVVQIYT